MISPVWMLMITLDTCVSYPPQCPYDRCIGRETVIGFPTQDRYECQSAIDEIMRAADLPKGMELKVHCEKQP